MTQTEKEIINLLEKGFAKAFRFFKVTKKSGLAFLYAESNDFNLYGPVCFDEKMNLEAVKSYLADQAFDNKAAKCEANELHRQKMLGRKVEELDGCLVLMDVAA